MNVENALGDAVPNAEDPTEQRPRYCLNTEGNVQFLREPTITAEGIAEKGGWPASQGVVQVNEDNTERNLAPGEVVTLGPGIGFCRRVRWKRGFQRAERILAEIELLKTIYPGLEVKDNWVRIPDVKLPAGWNRSQTDVAFQIGDPFPGAPPYGLYVPAGLRFDSKIPDKYTEPASSIPPFAGSWAMFSWAVHEDSDWRATADVRHGSNLLMWVRGFSQRFAEGA